MRNWAIDRIGVVKENLPPWRLILWNRAIVSEGGERRSQLTLSRLAAFCQQSFQAKFSPNFLRESCERGSFAYRREILVFVDASQGCHKFALLVRSIACKEFLIGVSGGKITARHSANIPS